MCYLCGRVVVEQRLGVGGVGVGVPAAPLARREHAPLAHGAHALVLRQPRVDAHRVVRYDTTVVFNFVITLCVCLNNNNNFFS